jgi:hypothetical protein
LGTYSPGPKARHQQVRLEGPAIRVLLKDFKKTVSPWCQGNGLGVLGRVAWEHLHDDKEEFS